MTTCCSSQRAAPGLGTRAQLRAICEKSTLPDIRPQKGVEERGGLTGPRGYEGTGVQGYMPHHHHRLRTLHTQAQTRSPAARSPKPPLPPHLLLKRRVAQDKPLAFRFFWDRGGPRKGGGLGRVG